MSTQSTTRNQKNKKVEKRKKKRICSERFGNSPGSSPEEKEKEGYVW